MRDIQRFLKEFGYILGVASLAALAAGLLRKLVWLASWDAITIALLAGGVLLGAAFILGNPDQVRTVLTRRGTRYGLNAAVMSIAFIAILVGLNFLAEQYHYRYDATEAQQHTLSPQSKQVVAGITRPVTIIGFFTDNDYAQRDSFQELLDQYLYHSTQLSYEIIDPDRDPLRARTYEEPYTGLLIQSGDRIERVFSASEQDITGALLRVTSEKAKVVYFLEGHDERDPNSSAEDGYSDVADKLREQNYEVRPLKLAITETVPSDAAVVVIAGPRRQLLDDELTRLQSYLASGGRALVMQDPFFDTGLNVVLSNWQVRFGAGYVIDPIYHLARYPDVPSPATYRYSPITKDMERLVTYFPVARPIEQSAATPEGVTYASLAETTEQSWSETGATEGRDESDLLGPLTLVASVESPPMFGTGETKTRIVLIGDADFAINAVAQVPGNTQLFLNAINWLAEEEMLIAIGPKDSWRQPVVLTEVGGNIIFLLSIIVIPGGTITTGITVWALRKLWSRIGNRAKKEGTEQ
jgi:ABC-type uncharacterized transport system involved in gliding motility auxiliary subunit